MRPRHDLQREIVHPAVDRVRMPRQQRPRHEKLQVIEGQIHVRLRHRLPEEDQDERIKKCRDAPRKIAATSPRDPHRERVQRKDIKPGRIHSLASLSKKSSAWKKSSRSPFTMRCATFTISSRCRSIAPRFAEKTGSQTDGWLCARRRKSRMPLPANFSALRSCAYAASA